MHRSNLRNLCILLDSILQGLEETRFVSRQYSGYERLWYVGLTEEQSEFFNSLVYLGLRIDRKGFHLAENSIKAIIETPHLTSVNELQWFWYS